MSALNQESIRRFANLELFAREVVEGFLTGLHKSPYHGFSVEFAEHRQYNRGESIRHIDWKLYGRTEKLFVKKYEEETNLRCQLIIDTSSSMFFPFHNEQAEPGKRNKLDFAIHASAALSYLFSRQRDAVGLTTFNNSIELNMPAKGSLTHRKRMYTELENALDYSSQSQASFLVDALHEVADSIPRRSLVVLFSDMFDNSGESLEDLFSAIQHLRHNRHEVIVFNVLDKSKERELEFEDRPYRFIDPETGEEVKLNPLSIRKNYQQKMEEYQHQLELKCGQYRVDYQEVDINEGFEPVLLAYLVKRSKLP